MGRPRGTNYYFDRINYYTIVCKHCNFLIDKEDYEKAKKFRWFSKIYKLTGKYYAYSHLKGNKKILLHRYLLDIDDERLVDHINGNTLDNRRSNLRIASRLQNNVNSKKRKNCKSKYKGLMLRPSGRWGVYIKFQGINYCLGTFDNEIEAAKVYNKKALEFYGEYARLNQIEGD